MTTTIRNSLQKGVVLAIILIFLMLIGFLLVISRLIGRALSTDLTSTTNLIVFIVITGFWMGSAAAKTARSWLQAAVAGLLTGLSAGLLVGALAFVLGNLYAGGADLRTYLSAVSKDAVNHFLLYRTPVDGALSHLIILTVSSLAGALIGQLLRLTVAFGRLYAFLRTRTVRPISGWLHSAPIARYVLLAMLVIGLLLLPMRWGSYWNYIMGTVGLYILMGLGLNLIVGLSGQLVLGYVAFFGIGAYGYALLTSPLPHNLQWSFWPALLAAVILAALAGILIGFPILRLRGDYLAIVTLGFGEIIRILLRSDLLTPFTGGPRGVRNLAQPTVLGQPFSGEAQYMYLILLAVFLLIFITSRVQNSATGRSWIAIREDETVAQATGVDTYKYKLLALALGAAFAGLAGGLFASRNQFTGPEDHILMVSINVLCLVIVGGMGSIPGVILGALVLKGLPEMLRDLENYRLLVFGALLVVMMILRPEGLWPAGSRRLEQPSPQDEPADSVPGALELEARQ